jgi:hypothetical protein
VNWEEIDRKRKEFDISNQKRWGAYEAPETKEKAEKCLRIRDKQVPDLDKLFKNKNKNKENNDINFIRINKSMFYSFLFCFIYK